MLKRFAFAAGLVLGLLGLVGCATPNPGPPVYHEVKVELPVSCIPPELGPMPDSLEDPLKLLEVTDGPEFLVRVTADWLARVARMLQTEPAVAACRAAAPPPGPAH